MIIILIFLRSLINLIMVLDSDSYEKYLCARKFQRNQGPRMMTMTYMIRKCDTSRDRYFKTVR